MGLIEPFYKLIYFYLFFYFDFLLFVFFLLLNNIPSINIYLKNEILNFHRNNFI